ncbi:MAG: methyltransferase [Bacteroidota bacterium]
MGRNNYFKFKQFTIIQEKSAMKVGTDGILLGAWANVASTETMLDIGAGTGLITLMLAQRSEAGVVGIEIEKNAAAEAQDNVSNSPWKNRVNILNQSLQEFAASSEKSFDLIVSNPPFFVNNKKNNDSNLAMARHADSLPPGELLGGVLKLLKTRGRFAVILPVQQATDLIRAAEENKLFLVRLTKLAPDETKESHRYLMEFSRNQDEIKSDRLNIFNVEHSDYTAEYKNLTRDFYLNF